MEQSGLSLRSGMRQQLELILDNVVLGRHFIEKGNQLTLRADESTVCTVWTAWIVRADRFGNMVRLILRQDPSGTPVEMDDLGAKTLYVRFSCTHAGFKKNTPWFDLNGASHSTEEQASSA